MKETLKIMMLAAVLALTGCGKSPEDMIVGRWNLDFAIEKVTEEGVGTVSMDTLPGYDSQVIQFLEDATCVVNNRGETTTYQWSITDGRVLVLFREGWAEDYALNMLTNQRLVYSDTYNYFDSISHKRYNYKYRFEYKRL